MGEECMFEGMGLMNVPNCNRHINSNLMQKLTNKYIIVYIKI